MWYLDFSQYTIFHSPERSAIKHVAYTFMIFVFAIASGMATNHYLALGSGLVWLNTNSCTNNQGYS